MPMRRRLIAVLVAPAVLLAVVLAAFLFRLPLAEMLIRGQISGRGLESQLRVAALGLHEAELRDISVSHLRIARLRVRFSLGELRRGVIEAAEVEGVTVTVDLTGKGPILGDLQRLLESTGERAWTRLPDLTLRRARVLVLLPREQLPVDVSARVTRGAGDTAALALNASGLSRDLRASGIIRAKFEGLVPVEGILTADLAHRREPLKLSLRANTDSLRAERPDTKFSLMAEGPLLALASEFGYPENLRPGSGSFRLSADGHVSMGVAPKPFDRPEGEGAFKLAISDLTLAQPADWLRNAQGSAAAELKFADRTIEGSASFDLAGGRGKLAAKFPLLRLVLDEKYAPQTLTLPDLSARLSGLPTPYGRLGDVAMAGSLEGPVSTPHGPLRITAAAPVLRLNDIAAETVTLAADIALAADDAGYRVSLVGSPGTELEFAL